MLRRPPDRNPGASERPPRSAFDRAVRLLERRPHFRREVELKLARAGFAPEEIDAAVARLTELGHIDDAAHAKSYAASLALRKRYGAARIRQELARRGAAPAAIAAALEGGDRESELERARDAATAWSRKGGGKATVLARHLERRGFASDVVLRVLRERFPDGFHAD